MTINFRKVLLGIVFLLLDSGCKSRNLVRASRIKVVGGDVAQAGQFPAAIFIPGCSATRIGPKTILTAAHCVMDPAEWTLLPIFKTGERLAVFHGPTMSDAKGYQLEIESTLVHGSVKQSARYGGPLEATEFYDLAIIQVSGMPDSVATASIDPRPTQVSQNVLFTGYGCEELPPFMRNRPAGDVLTSQDLTAEERALRFKFKREPIDSVDGKVAVLKNRDIDENAIVWNVKDVFSGCPGDSGSGIYKPSAQQNSSEQVIVGVNSFVNTYGTAFVRLDQESLGETHSCLSKLTGGDASQNCFVAP